MKTLYLALGRDLAAPDAGATHTVNIARAVAAEGWEVTLAARAAGREIEGVRVIEAPAKKSAPFFPPSGLIARLASEARDADLVHERAEESGGVGVHVANATGKPLVLEINTPLSGHLNPLVRKLGNWNLRRQARSASAVITQTPAARNIIERYCRAPVHVVPNGADPALFHPAVAAAELPDEAVGRRIVAFAGSLRAWHGVEDLIEAGAQILAKHADCFFLFVGGGSRLGRFQELSQHLLGPGNYIFTGPVPPENVPALLAAADVLAAPFAPARDPVRRRQFARFGMWWSPVKIFEYMAMGKPVVAAAAGAVREYLAGAGATYPPGDVAALAQAVSKLLEEPPLAASLGRAARDKLLQHYTWRHAALATAAAWREVLRGRQKVSLIS